jgi:hypothetical protein
MQPELKIRSLASPFTVRAKIGLQLWSKDLEQPLAVLDRNQQATLTGMVAYPRDKRSYVVLQVQDKEYLAFGPQLEKVESNGT